MDDNSQDDSENDFPELPPNIMLDIELGPEAEGLESQFRIVSDDVYEDECPPEVIIEDDRQRSSSSSDSEEERAIDILMNDLPVIQPKVCDVNKSKEVDENAESSTTEVVIDGGKCYSCSSCQGYKKHEWRRVCNNCKCTKEDHEINSQEINGKMNDLSIIDDNDNEDVQEKILSQYAWVPPGLDAPLVQSYMKSLPENQVPKYENVEGMKYRNKQLLLQFPVQDTNFDHCKHIPKTSKHVFDQFTKAKEADMATGHIEKAFRNKECRNCHQNIEIGSAYVLAFNLGEEASWHPGCFQCSKCKELLMNLIFFHSEGEILCGRHYSEINKPRCGACDEIILFGEYVKASEQCYHVQHFCCWICDKELSGKQHLVEAQQPICIDCYNNKFANTCHKCNIRISMEDKDILYDNHHWHDTCLKCVVCNETLSGRSFLTRENDEFICTDCHRKTDTRRCKTCREGFEPGMKRLELNGVYWHDTCFICELCKEPISSKRFMRHQDLTVCVRCYEDTFVKKCMVCKMPLTQGGISYNGEAYHKDCFVCVKCNASIANQAFSVKDDERFCVECYSNLFAKKCKACSDYIMSGEYYTLDDDTWHKDCFRCTKCGEALANSSFVQEGDEVLLVCESCIEAD